MSSIVKPLLKSAVSLVTSAGNSLYSFCVECVLGNVNTQYSVSHFKAFSSDPRSNGSASINLVHRICVRTRPRIPSLLPLPLQVKLMRDRAVALRVRLSGELLATLSGMAAGGRRWLCIWNTPAEQL
jgi:hypothetical protein